MVRIVVTALADADVADILADLNSEAGSVTAERFNARFERLYERLADHPDSGPLRPILGSHIRIGVVFPYIVIYRHVEGADTVSLIRVLHGRRRFTRKLLRG
ncbi:MAG TPA: type II toxin-antitoxin system RelE/ParE family toxin [Methylovirgula sp.]